MRVSCVVAGLAILLSTGVVAAGSQPVITGKVEGMETCPQSSCGAAQFLGTSQLQVDMIQGKGGFFVQVTHGPLPLLPGGNDTNHRRPVGIECQSDGFHRRDRERLTGQQRQQHLYRHADPSHSCERERYVELHGDTRPQYFSAYPCWDSGSVGIDT